MGRDVLIWLGLLGLILSAVWMSVGLQAWQEQSVYFYINRNAAELRDPALNWSKIWGMLAGWPLLSLLAAWGAARCGVKFKQFGWIPLVWQLTAPPEDRFEEITELRQAENPVYRLRRLPFEGQFNPAT